jgi:hypothetical protein
MHPGRAVKRIAGTRLRIPFGDFVRRHSALYRLVRARFGPALHAVLGTGAEIWPQYRDDRPEWQVTRALLHRFADDCRARDVPFLVVVFPTVNEVHRREISDRPGRMVAAACGERDVPVLDLLEGFRAAARRSGTDLYFPQDHHWTAAGHAVAADLLEAFLAENLPPLSD